MQLIGSLLVAIVIVIVTIAVVTHSSGPPAQPSASSRRNGWSSGRSASASRNCARIAATTSWLRDRPDRQ